MQKRKIKSTTNRRDLVTKVALGLLVVGGGLVALAIAPGLGAALKLIDPNPRKAVSKVERALRRLAKNGDVIAQDTGRQKKYRITSAGRQKLARLQFAEYQLPSPAKWDGKWRVVCFDIPETYKYKRTLLQTKLSDLGFYRLQNSIFVLPYPCAELVNLSYNALGLRKHVRLIVAEKIDTEAHLVNFFKLKQ